MEILTRFLETLPPVIAILGFVIWMLFKQLTMREKTLDRFGASIEAHTATLVRLTTLVEMMAGKGAHHA